MDASSSELEAGDHTHLSVESFAFRALYFSDFDALFSQDLAAIYSQTSMCTMPAVLGLQVGVSR